MFLADLGLGKLIPEQDKFTLPTAYRCLIGAVHLKALILASPLGGVRVDKGRRQQERELQYSSERRAKLHLCSVMLSGQGLSAPGMNLCAREVAEPTALQPWLWWHLMGGAAGLWRAACLFSSLGF